MLSFIPDSIILWLVNFVILLGVALVVTSYIVQYIPFIDKYRLPIQILGIGLLIGGVYFKGVSNTNKAWHDKIAELEKKVKLAEEKSKEKNTEIQTKIVTQTKYIKDVQVKTKTIIQNIAPSIDSECRINHKVIDILNSSAKNEVPKNLDNKQ
jgi:hypothetical protein